ncbi:aggregation-promoting factor C-terminal-like domain-containing protein [Kitasatospora mediocidica]|uniref:aggregation-promoting factor C-terminal-like domain-containing protein n=1 Tax=Kitasatospora mediocidica TaxID=58352 RepID=UPI0005660E9D|nr:hypothetical protein [Kitasatospora mediocidica]
MSRTSSRLRLSVTLVGLAASVTTGIAVAPAAFADSAPSPALVAQEQSRAEQMVSQKFPADAANEVAAFDSVITAESSWNPLAHNPHSTAAGLGQILGASTSDSYPDQLQEALNYMVTRYGDPIAAAAHEAFYGWY